MNWKRYGFTMNWHCPIRRCSIIINASISILLIEYSSTNNTKSRELIQLSHIYQKFVFKGPQFCSVAANLAHHKADNSPTGTFFHRIFKKLHLLYDDLHCKTFHISFPDYKVESKNNSSMSIIAVLICFIKSA